MEETNEGLIVPFHRAAVGEEEAQAAAEVVRSGWLTMGPKTIEFERKFAEYIGAKHAVAVSSCTAALHLALDALGISHGDEILVPTTTFTATAEITTYIGARPVLVDIDRKTLNLDPIDAARRITSRTKAILPVHVAGQPCDMAEIHELAKAHNLHVIEDAAHALPASYRGTRIGKLSELTTFSFYATKTLTTGEGGMVLTNNDAHANRVRLMRLHGIGRDAWKRYTADGSWYYEVLEAGYKYNMTDIQAALGLIQLTKCTTLRQARQRIAERYTSAFKDSEFFEVPRVRDDRESAWHLYILRLNLERIDIDRNRFIQELKQHGIGTSVHFIPLHLHPFYQRKYGYKKGDFPKAEAEYIRYFSLPIYPDMSNAQVERVISAVIRVASASGRSSVSKKQVAMHPFEKQGDTPSALSAELRVVGENADSSREVLNGSAVDEPFRAGIDEGKQNYFEPSRLQRCFDTACAATAVVLLSPVFALIAAAIKLADGGPILYSHRRVGKGFRCFQLHKFRTMVTDADHMGGPLTLAEDQRVTRIGHFLRKYKFDELPQLFNVVKGNIALVGPRPESERYVAMFKSQYVLILSHRPGITDPATLAYRNEETLLRGKDAEQLYIKTILPRKIELSIGYLQRRTFLSDLSIIVQTLVRICGPVAKSDEIVNDGIGA